jgi:hypothetical protein
LPSLASVRPPPFLPLTPLLYSSIILTMIGSSNPNPRSSAFIRVHPRNPRSGHLCPSIRVLSVLPIQSGQRPTIRAIPSSSDQFRPKKCKTPKNRSTLNPSSDLSQPEVRLCPAISRYVRQKNVKTNTLSPWNRWPRRFLYALLPPIYRPIRLLPPTSGTARSGPELNAPYDQV